MLQYVTQYSGILSHTGRVIDSCQTEMQLENAYSWANGVINNFFNKVMKNAGYYQTTGMGKLKEQAFAVIRERYLQRCKKLQLNIPE